MATHSEQGLAIADMIKEGKIVPAKVTIDLLNAAMVSAPAGTIVLIDGFPRDLANLELFETTVGMAELTLFFDLSAEVMEERLLERGKTSGRTDDNIETIKKRFATFTTQSVPVVAALKEKTTVIEIDASGGVDDIAAVVAAEIEKLK
mmetsp:Transcript_18231/g.46844  ORF Transcript_18231/g.46844 Transcript_18231/m.46844 type:complete len:148 (+) Transcript_18231:3-446(+)